MQKVIELGRICRDRRTVSLKTPLKTLVVLHQDQEFLDDVQKLERYITEELNVRDLVLTSEESKYGVDYSVLPDVKSLGQKFKKDAAKIKAALPKVSADELRSFLDTGKLVVEGKELTFEDLRVQRNLRESAETKNLEVGTQDDILVLLDAFAYPELAQEGLAREILNRIQRLRKRAGLVPTDDVQVAYSVLAPAGEDAAVSEGSRLEQERQIEEMFTGQSATFANAASKGIVKTGGSEQAAVDEEETDVKEIRLLLKLLKD